MQILDFDNINKYTEFKTWLTSLSPSQVMEKKQEIRDGVWDLLEYAYVLGFKDARDELGVVADGFERFLPDDYKDEPTVKSEATHRGSYIPKDFVEQKDASIYKKFGDEDFSQRVIKYAELGDVSSIVRVAETDGHRVYNDGGYEGAKDFATSKTWETMMDDKVRDPHWELEGVTVGMDDFFEIDGAKAKYPGDFGVPELDINCRCTISYNL